MHPSGRSRHAPRTHPRHPLECPPALASGAPDLDPLSGHLFVFINKRRDRIKVLYWDRDGLAVWAKRLERGTFRVPDADAPRVEMTTADLAALLAGIDLDAARRRPRYTRPVIAV